MPAAPVLLLFSFAVGDPTPAAVPAVDFYPWRANIARFAEAIEQLEARDQALYEAGGPQEGSILLAGSSSVRIWMENGNVHRALAPIPVVARGYGGARFSDFAWYADRLFAPHLTPGQPGANVAAIALFVGNDISGKSTLQPGDQTPAGAAAFVRHTIATAHAMDADVPVLLIGVTPTPARFAGWPNIRRFNKEMARIAADDPTVHYLDPAPTYLDDEGRPRAALFVADRLHQNEAGYKIWAKLIKQAASEMLGKEN
ncbi:MAG: GDSL-type esterase/lipase family protein [Planctomycetota bacterium]